MTARSFLDTIYSFLSRRPVYHAIFWAIMFVTIQYLGSVPLTYGRVFQQGAYLIVLAFFIIPVYVNLRYLVPQYLPLHLLLYVGAVLILCAIVMPIKLLALYFYYNDSRLRLELVDAQFSLFIGIVMVTLLSTMLHVVMDWWRYQQEKQELKTQTIQSELRFLKSQINPHFLFNTLNNLYALTLKKSDAAPEIVLKLSEIMRYMLYECNEKQVLLTKEIHYLHNYLDLERLRQPGNADIRFTTEGMISEQLVAPLLFVPFLENSFKHGLNHHIHGGGFVRLHLSVKGDDLTFYIENSKTEKLPRQEHHRSGGIGLANVRQRLEMLYPGKHAIETEDEPHRYAVTLHLKLI